MKLLILIPSFISLILLTTGSVFAADMIPINPPPNVLNDPNYGIKNLIQFVLGIIAAIGTIIPLIFIVIGGIKWATSGGDKQKVEAARGTLVMAIVGLMVVLLCLVIMNIVFELVGLNKIFDVMFFRFV